MRRLRPVVEGWLLLLYFDWLMRFRGFDRMHAIVREQKVRIRTTTEVSNSALSRGVDLACVFYFKRVLCLQRSAATTVLLRRYGRKAEMVIGVQLLPFQSHAWVEVDGCVVNDKPYMAEMFEVMERC